MIDWFRMVQVSCVRGDLGRYAHGDISAGLARLRDFGGQKQQRNHMIRYVKLRVQGTGKETVPTMFAPQVVFESYDL